MNRGIYNPPTLIKNAFDGEGKEVGVPRAPQQRVISEQSSAQVRELMQAVVDTRNGQRNLKLDRYTSGGKTGTAQRADTSCRCYRGYVTSFIGFAPHRRPADSDLCRDQQPAQRRDGNGHSSACVSRHHERGPAALLGRSGCQAAQAAAH